MTGAARGQGRNHALRLAQEGADIIAVDVPGDYTALEYELATPADLAETARLVRAAGRRVVTAHADVRDPAALTAAVDEGVAHLGHLDVVVANAAVVVLHTWDEVTPDSWKQVVDTNLTGVWNTMTASVPHLISAGGGSIICTGSISALKGTPFFAPYTAAKHGVLGLARAMANELGRHAIRVNTVHPTGVNTEMVRAFTRLDEVIAATDPNLGSIFTNTLHTPAVGLDDVSSAVVYLASDEARFVTGTELKVDAGNSNR